MKKEKMKQLVKRLPNEGLSDLAEVLDCEVVERKKTGKYTSSLPSSMKDFCDRTLPKGF